MPTDIVETLLSDVRRGVINKDELLKATLEALFLESPDKLYEMCIEEGFIVIHEEKEDVDAFEKLDATQRIIEKVLARHGE